MKNKGFLFTIFVILIILAVLVGVVALVFSVRTFEVQSTNAFETLNQWEITSYFEKEYKGQNMFFLSEEKLKTSFQQKFPYGKLLDVERVFPSNVIVKIEERVPLYGIFYNSNYFIFDIENTLLEISGDALVKDKIIILENYTPENIESLTLGKVATFDGKSEEFVFLQKFFETMTLLSYEYTDFEMKNFIKSIETTHAKDIYITTKTNIKLNIFNPSLLLEQKVQRIMAAFNSGMASVPGQTIYIGDNLIAALTKPD